MGREILQYRVMEKTSGIVEEHIDAAGTDSGNGCHQIGLSAVIDAVVIAQLTALGKLLGGTGKRLFEKSSIGGTSAVHWRDDCQIIPYRPS